MSIITPNALILAGDGLNCEQETAFALELAGAHVRILHINALFENPKQLLDAAMLAIPGGFSFGDEISSGKLLALKLRYSLGDVLTQFIQDGRPVLGICNGFQTLVKLGVLPKSNDGAQQRVTLTHNRQRRFINQWVELRPNPQCAFFRTIDTECIQLPIRHGEGRLVLGADLTPETLVPHIALQYKHDVNGSHERIAGLCNESGTVLGLMPHPEAFVRQTQHPNWTAERGVSKKPAGLQIFENMVAMVNTATPTGVAS
jgi:phosphoribosylformylglycinamidine synthase subunit PurQ / glutaminase